ncbi:putative Glycosyl hydrolase family 65 central catalytic domain/Haloacid dehalogenase-like hydrolase [Trypanosoma cruzi]|nr:putative Glycosyl hydrolase family 65 central catalytic domain/Haloacid dehalogenase-like hydrolase [Trypanosoma cruzi]
MPFWRRSPLAREYEVTKRPIFLLDGWNIVQGTDAAAYVSGSVTDGVMYGTNGYLGVRHRSECETVGFESNVFVNGVYHNVPVDRQIDSEALPYEMQMGAAVCTVNLDCLIDGDCGTLRSVPPRRLDLRNATYHSECRDVMSGDGGLMFDGDYRRVVSMKELDLWGADIVYSNFTFGSSPYDLYLGESPNIFYSNNMNSTNPDASPSYLLEFVVTITVDLREWAILRGDSVDDILLQSRTSGVVESIVTQSTCAVDYENSSVKITPEHQLLCETGDHGLMEQNFSAAALSCPSDSESDPGFGGRIISSFENQKKKTLSFKKRFIISITPDTLPTRVTVTYLARHHSGGIPSARLFPTISEIMEDQRLILNEFWDHFLIDLQQQEELTPDRLRLSLLFNAFRLFCVSHNLHNGLPRGGCSATKTSLLYDLHQYLYHGIFYTLTSPPRALALLRGLYSLLPQARVNAHRISLKHGAIFPRSTIKGTECEQHNTVSQARLHVNAEIGYIINFFFAAVETIDQKDRLWLLELMLETARVWPQLGEWVESEGVFRLDNIAGPDEYNSTASGNFYIHLSAKMHMRYVLDLYEQQLALLGEEAMTNLLKQIDMDKSELENFRATSDGIVIRRNDHLGVYLVHDYFHTLKEWKGERPKHPLSMNYHPLAIFSHMLVDIPEVLLGMLLYQEEFEKKDLVRNLAHYEALCTYDSPESLAIVAAVDFQSNGSFAHAVPLLRSLMSLDVDNVIYTADEGLHFGVMSSSWIAIVSGIGRLKLGKRTLYLDPCFPAGLSIVKFTICWRGSTLSTTVDKDYVTYELIAGDSIRFVHGDGHRIHLHTGFHRYTAKRQVSVPRLIRSSEGEFDGAVFLCETLFDEITDIHYMAWYKTLESLFENYRALHLREIQPLTTDEFFEKVIYQAEEREIAFSGIHNVLLDRGIDLELGTPDDAEIVETRYGLANAKVAEMAEILSRMTPRVNAGMHALLKDLSNSGIALAVVTYSRSLKTLMHYNPEVMPLFLAYIDGEEAHDRHIKSRPHVDIFLRAAEKIHVNPARCVVFSMYLDRGFKASSLANFRMFFDVEGIFATKRVSQQTQPYPTLSNDAAAAVGRDGVPLILRLSRENLPTTIDALEDMMYGRCDAVDERHVASYTK